MADILSVEDRSKLMSRIRGRDTKPEMIVRRGLHALGLRFRLQARKLPGRPDLVFPKYHTAVFVHGCFWHAHGCGLSKLPGTRVEFWKQKLDANVARDQAAVRALREAGWRVLLVWECAFRGPGRLGEDEALRQSAAFIKSADSMQYSVKGRGSSENARISEVNDSNRSARRVQKKPVKGDSLTKGKPCATVAGTKGNDHA